MTIKAHFEAPILFVQHQGVETVRINYDPEAKRAAKYITDVMKLAEGVLVAGDLEQDEVLGGTFFEVRMDELQSAEHKALAVLANFAIDASEDPDHEAVAISILEEHAGRFLKTELLEVVR